MNTTQAAQMGIEHAMAGKQCTPFDCREADQIFLTAAKSQTKHSQAKEYSTLRGAFNAGWQKQYFAMVSA